MTEEKMSNEMFDVIDEEIKPQELAVLKHERDVNIEKANSMVITSAETYLDATDFLKTLKGMQKEAETKFEKSIKASYAAWKEICNLKNSIVEPLAEAERLLKGKAIAYNQEQERIAAAKQARIDAQKRKEQEELLAKAKKAEEKGQTEKAENLMQQAQNMPAPVVEKAVPKNSGISIKKNWKFRVKDVNAIPREYMIPNEKALQGIATSTKGSIKIPGVEFYSEDNMSARG